jgi:aminoglycoside/choline kinase family phosphotransferase
MATEIGLPVPWTRHEVLVGDASHRRYARIWDRHDQTAILVRYPETVRKQMVRDLEVRAWCEAKGLRVPRLFDHSIDDGWAVLEDFGAHDAEAFLERFPTKDRRDRALPFLDPLAHLARFESSDLPSWNPPLDGERMRWELAGFELWFLRHRLDRLPSPAIGRWLDELAESIEAHPKRVCHRDYHLNNLFVLPDGETGVIDYQDILIGPDTYDAVSLLGERGMPRLVPEAARERLREAWAGATAASTGWIERWRMVSLQRGLKVLGTFARLTATGLIVYEPWIGAQIDELSAQTADANAPSELVDLLLNLSRRRHRTKDGSDPEVAPD